MLSLIHSIANRLTKLGPTAFPASVVAAQMRACENKAASKRRLCGSLKISTSAPEGTTLRAYKCWLAPAQPSPRGSGSRNLLPAQAVPETICRKRRRGPASCTGPGPGWSRVLRSGGGSCVQGTWEEVEQPPGFSPRLAVWPLFHRMHGRNLPAHPRLPGQRKALKRRREG